MNTFKRWLRGWQMLTIEEAEQMTGIGGVLISLAVLTGRAKSLRRRDVEKWAKTASLAYRSK